MDTKLKNINEVENQDTIDDKEFEKDYRRINLCKGVALIIAAFLFSVAFISLDDLKSNKSSFSDKGVYGSQYIGNEIYKFTERVAYLTEFYKSEEYIKDKGNLTSVEIQNKKQKLEEEYKEEYSKEEEKIYSKYRDELEIDNYSKEISEEKIKLHDELEKKYKLSDEQIIELITQEKLITFKKEINALNSYDNLKYISYDKKNNIWLSNFKTGKDAIEELKEKSRFFGEYNIIGGNTKKIFYIDGQHIRQGSHKNYRFDYDYIENIAPNFEYNPLSELSIYISVPKTLQPGDDIYSGFKNFQDGTQIVRNEVFIFIGSFLGFLIMILVLKRLGKKKDYLDIIVKRLKEVRIEIKVLIGFIAWFMYISLYQYRYYENYTLNLNINNILLLTIVAIVWYLVGRALLQNYKDGTLFKDSYSIIMIQHIKESMKKGSFGRYIIIKFIIYVVVCVVTTFFLCFIFGGFGMVLAFTFDLVATLIMVFNVFRDFSYLNKISYGAKMLSEGKLNADIEEMGNSSLRELAHSINNIKKGLRKSLENENKSERMKTELISNVSHDLKTPLTSIINYVDLLKKQDIKPEEARAYVEVLDKKSQRLKLLIEDLFEASKAASGAMELNLSRLEVNALLNQTIGEAQGRISSAALDFKVSIPKEKIYIEADGRKLWRVFENLISNAIKYSLKNTRVYVDVLEYNGEVHIVFKNISAYELNFNVEEITERFKRGDEARHTEGSGLGLAIAKSIVDLHGGKLELGIDGDLFKVIVKLKTIN